MIQASDCNKSLCRLMISPRCGEPASSSPSKRNLMYSEGLMFCARKESNAVRIPMTPALSSDEDRAYSRHSELIAPSAGKVTMLPPDSSAAVRHVGCHGSVPVHCFASVG